jgi:hypothetical protein
MYSGIQWLAFGLLVLGNSCSDIGEEMGAGFHVATAEVNCVAKKEVNSFSTPFSPSLSGARTKGTLAMEGGPL